MCYKRVTLCRVHSREHSENTHVPFTIMQVFVFRCCIYHGIFSLLDSSARIDWTGSSHIWIEDDPCLIYTEQTTWHRFDSTNDFQTILHKFRVLGEVFDGKMLASEGQNCKSKIYFLKHKKGILLIYSSSLFLSGGHCRLFCKHIRVKHICSLGAQYSYN